MVSISPLVHYLPHTLDGNYLSNSKDSWTWFHKTLDELNFDPSLSFPLYIPS